MREIAQLLAVKGGSPFRSRAYERGARALEGLGDDIGTLVAEERLTAVPDIGPGLAGVISDLHRSGRSDVLDRLRRELPPGVLALRQVPALTLRRISALHRGLGIDSVASLQAACEAGQVRTLPGFGEKTERRILESLRQTGGTGVLHLDRALELGERLVRHLQSSPAATEVELAGEVRRRCETVARIDTVVATEDPGSVIAHFLRFPLVSSEVARGGGRCEAVLADGIRAEVRTASPSEYPLVLLDATGSNAHCDRLVALARERGLSLGDLEPRAIPDEAGIYAHLGLQYVPPELREDQGEIEAAQAGELPADLVSLPDIQGMVHCHTRYSDGRDSVEQMARAAEALGMRYITITDHSPTASYAGGVSLDRLKQQWEEIERARETVGIAILRGTESDILADGALDYPDSVLESFDVIIASIHSRHKMDVEAMTRRLVRAMKLPFFKIWGHALGRLIERRPPIACRLDEVLDAAASSPTAIEVNANPRRLDMAPAGLRAARARGLRFVVSTDAHSVAELRNLRYGIDTARRGWVRRGEVLNTLSAEAFREAVRPTR